MISIDDLPEDRREYFCKMVDECIMDGDGDPESKEAFEYLNDMAYNLGVTIYDVFLQVYEDSEIIKHIDDWKKEKGFK